MGLLDQWNQPGFMSAGLLGQPTQPEGGLAGQQATDFFGTDAGKRALLTFGLGLLSSRGSTAQGIGQAGLGAMQGTTMIASSSARTPCRTCRCSSCWAR